MSSTPGPIFVETTARLLDMTPQRA